jgi:tRNA(Arg) A34 adenosine deaminase TadA
MCKTRHTLTAYCYDRKGKLLSKAENNYKKSHPIQAHFANLVGMPARIYLHAEIHALIKAGDKQVYKIVIMRIGKNHKPLNAKPCPICAAALKAYGVQFISYTTGKE